MLKPKRTIGNDYINIIKSTPQRLITSAQKANVVIKELGVHTLERKPCFVCMKYVSFGYTHEGFTDSFILRDYTHSATVVSKPFSYVTTSKWAVSILWELYDENNSLIDIDAVGNTSCLQIFPLEISLYKWIARSFSGYGYIGKMDTKHTGFPCSKLKLKDYKKFKTYINTLKELSEPFYRSSDRLAYLPTLSIFLKRDCFLLTGFSSIQITELFRLLHNHMHVQIASTYVLIKLDEDEPETEEE